VITGAGDTDQLVQKKIKELKIQTVKTQKST
jgi:hypothetical protein